MPLAFRGVLAAIILGLSLAEPAAAGPFDDATAAMKRDDYATAHRLLVPLAENGDAKAQFNLGLLYAYGRGVAMNNGEAVKWYRKASDQGDTLAQTELGSMYKFGWGTTKNPAEAVKLFRLAADKGNADAQYSLGRMYEAGVGVSQDDSEALKWYGLAANQHSVANDTSNCGYGFNCGYGSAWAQHRLGQLSEFGMTGKTRNEAEAVKWYHLAANQGYMDSQYYLGEMYFYGGDVIKQDYAEAYKWYRLAVDQGHSLAKIALGKLYMQGAGVPQNFILAYMWFHIYEISEPAYLRRLVERELADIAQHMAPSQIAEAQKLAREWKPKRER